MRHEMNKELLQQVIDHLMPSNPKQEEFEADLKELLSKHERPIRLYCEGQSNNHDIEL